LTIRPVPALDRPLDERVGNLVHRMISAAVSGADGVFVWDPAVPEAGLFRGDGTPGELLLPWRTAAAHLSGATEIGRLLLPGGSENRVFRQRDRMLVVAWNGMPRREAVWLGAQAEQLDVWGRRQPLERDDGGQYLSVDRMPTFVVGADPAVVQTLLGVTLEPRRFPSRPGTAQELRIRIPNAFDRAVSGRCRLHLPEKWQLASAETVPLAISKGSEAVLVFRVRLPFLVSDGDHRLTLELDWDAEEKSARARRRIRVHREIGVGLDDVSVELTGQLDRAGNLRVRQRFTNRGAGPVSFDCRLLIPGQRMQRSALRQVPPGSYEHEYVIPDGAGLAGKSLWLRAEEQGGRRVVSQRLVPTP